MRTRNEVGKAGEARCSSVFQAARSGHNFILTVVAGRTKLTWQGGVHSDEQPDSRITAEGKEKGDAVADRFDTWALQCFARTGCPGRN